MRGAAIALGADDYVRDGGGIGRVAAGTAQGGLDADGDLGEGKPNILSHLSIDTDRIFC